MTTNEFIDYQIKSWGWLPSKLFSRLIIVARHLKGGIQGKYMYRNRKHWIYIDKYTDGSGLVHELNHALYRAFQITEKGHEYRYEPEEQISVIWEIKWLKMVKKFKDGTIIKLVRKETRYPGVFIRELIDYGKQI